MISSFDAQLSTINRQIAQTTDPNKIQKLIKAATLIRRCRKNEMSARRLQLRHLRDRTRPSRRKRKFDVDKTADPLKMVGTLQKLVDQHPDLAQLIAKQMCINNPEVTSILDKILNDTERKRQLAEFFALVLTELVKGVITQFGKPSISPQQTVPPQPAQPTGQQPMPYFGLIDHTRPRPVQ